MSKRKSKKWGWWFGKKRKNAYSLNTRQSSPNTRQSSLNDRPYGEPGIRGMDVKFATKTNRRNQYQELVTFQPERGAYSEQVVNNL